METLGEKLKQLRNELTQEELAVILQVDRSTLASWEINRREPDIATLCRIASHFGVSIDWLVGYQPESASSFKTSRFLEEGSHYLTDGEGEWQEVIKIAQEHGLAPGMVSELLRVNIEVALALRKNCSSPKGS